MIATVGVYVLFVAAGIAINVPTAPVGDASHTYVGVPTILVGAAVCVNAAGIVL